MVLQLLLSLALATDSSTPPLLQQRQNIRQEVKQEVQQRIEERQETKQEVRQEVKSRIADNHSTRLASRFGLYYDRLANIHNRLQTHLTTLQSQGKDTSLVQVKLTKSKADLELAKTKGSEAVTAFREQQEQPLRAKDLALEARKLFLQVHRSLKEILLDLRQLK